MDFPLLSQESIDNHHLDPVRILQDFHRYVQNALTADENSHPRDNDPVFQAKMNKDSRPPIPKSTKVRDLDAYATGCQQSSFCCKITAPNPDCEASAEISVGLPGA
ncbi:unnamed protein product [Lepidochelys kempii]